MESKLFMDVGTLLLEKMEENYFQYTTGIVQYVHALDYRTNKVRMIKNWDGSLMEVSDHFLISKRKGVTGFRFK